MHAKKRLRTCDRCHGIGIIQTKTPSGIRLDHCKCREKEILQKSLEYANIPKKYRKWDLRGLTKEFRRINHDALKIVQRYSDDLELNIRKSKGLWFSSPPGAAKSSIICSLLKSAIEKKYVAHYMKAYDLYDLQVRAYRDIEAREFLEYLRSDVQILAIEDLEKVYISKDWENFPNTMFFRLLGDIDDANIALLISSNDTRDSILEKFPPHIHSIFSNSKDVIFRYYAR